MFVKYAIPRVPETPEEKEAIDVKSIYSCSSRSPEVDGFLVFAVRFCCTRKALHDGKHIAGGFEKIYAEWNDED